MIEWRATEGGFLFDINITRSLNPLSSPTIISRIPQTMARPIPAPTPILIPASPDFPLNDTLRHDLQSALVRDNAVTSISNALSTECEKAGWQDAVKMRVMQILKSGEVESRQELVKAIVREARDIPIKDEGAMVGEKEKGEGKGKTGERVEGNGSKGTKGGEKAVDIKMPNTAVTEAVKAVRDTLEKVVEIEPEKGFWD